MDTILSLLAALPFQTTPLSLLGHLCYGLSAAAFLMHNIIWLRIMGIVSCIMGAIYNGSIATGFLGPKNPELWTGTTWMFIFMAINAYHLRKLLVARRAARRSEAAVEQGDLCAA